VRRENTGRAAGDKRIIRWPGAAVDRFSASHVYIQADTEHGEGWIVFQWPDETYGDEQLKIDLDGHCSRRMPIQSGSGLPEFVEMDADRIRLRFDVTLAYRLKLAEEIEITYRLTEQEFEDLRRAVDYFGGTTKRPELKPPIAPPDTGPDTG
jgi:hypothetical protein